MEVYFTGTIERIILKISATLPYSPFRYRDTNAEDFDDFEIIVTGPWLMLSRRRIHFLGQIVQHSKYWRITAGYERAKPTSKDWSNTLAVISKGLVLKTPKRLWNSMGK